MKKDPVETIDNLLDEHDQLGIPLIEVGRQIDRHALFCTMPSSVELRQWAEHLDAYLRAEEVLRDVVGDALNDSCAAPRQSAIRLH